MIETERLRHRELLISDAPFIFELVNDPMWIRYIGDRNIRSLEDARTYIESGPRVSYEQYGFGLYLVELADSQTPIGISGLIKREGLEHVDIGFAFLPAYRRQGYARESAAMILTHGQKMLGFNKILAITDPDNRASIRLLESIGMSFEKMIRFGEEGEELRLFKWESTTDE